MIELDSEHRYWEVKDGKKREIPGVSYILDVMGKKGKYYAKDSTFYKTRGSFAHTAIALDVAGELEESSVDQEIRGYLEAWRKFRREWHVVVMESERPVYCEELDYCGRLDLVLVVDGIVLPVLTDAKSGSPAPWHELQVAAYAYAHAGLQYRSFLGAPLYLRQKGTYSFKPMEPLKMDRKVEEWRDLVREFHERETKVWT